MKSFLLIFLILPSLSRAASLEDSLSRENKGVIEPVSFEGNYFAEGWDIAASLCAALGYTRLVSFEVEPCVLGEDLTGATARSTTAVRFQKQFSKCGKASHERNRLKSVTCAESN